MNIAVRYYSKGGNTKTLANAIGEELGVEVHSTDKPLEGTTDILFLGSSVYAAGVDAEVKKFIDSLDSNSVKLVVPFSTAAILSSTYNQVKKLLDAKSISISKKEFHCRGAFAVMHKGHPNAADVAEVKQFAKEIVAELKTAD